MPIGLVRLLYIVSISCAVLATLELIFLVTDLIDDFKERKREDGNEYQDK